jgi:hypothetical protein
MKRTKLFKLQGLISILLILVATAHFALDAEMADIFKVVIAPFGAISLLLFSFFVYRQNRKELNDDEEFGKGRILANLGIVAISAVVIVFLTTIIGDFTSTLDRVLFGFSILVAAVVFIFERIRDFRSMAILTGVAEGVTVLLIFFK